MNTRICGNPILATMIKWKIVKDLRREIEREKNLDIEGKRKECFVIGAYIIIQSTLLLFFVEKMDS